MAKYLYLNDRLPLSSALQFAFLRFPLASRRNSLFCVIFHWRAGEVLSVCLSVCLSYIYVCMFLDSSQLNATRVDGAVTCFGFWHCLSCFSVCSFLVCFFHFFFCFVPLLCIMFCTRFQFRFLFVSTNGQLKGALPSPVSRSRWQSI